MINFLLFRLSEWQWAIKQGIFFYHDMVAPFAMEHERKQVKKHL